MEPIIIFDFNEKNGTTGWTIVDDVVMGGRSNGTMRLNEVGHGIFSGEVSLENNGGFSSVRYRMDPVKTDPNQLVKIRLKGDGKRYQFRIKHDSDTYYSYITYFETTGDWQTIEVPLKELYPSFRGRKLSGPNFSHDTIEEVTFLVANKRAERFELIVDKIELV